MSVTSRLILLVLCSVLISYKAISSENKLIRSFANGYAAINDGNYGSARSNALADALRQASLSNGVDVSSVTVINQNILTYSKSILSSNKRVVGYKILDELVKEGILELSVEAYISNGISATECGVRKRLKKWVVLRDLTVSIMPNVDPNIIRDEAIIGENLIKEIQTIFGSRFKNELNRNENRIDSTATSSYRALIKPRDESRPSVGMSLYISVRASQRSLSLLPPHLPVSTKIDFTVTFKLIDDRTGNLVLGAKEYESVDATGPRFLNDVLTTAFPGMEHPFVSVRKANMEQVSKKLASKLYSVTACEEFLPNITEVKGSRITANVGSDEGASVGDVFRLLPIDGNLDKAWTLIEIFEVSSTKVIGKVVSGQIMPKIGQKITLLN